MTTRNAIISPVVPQPVDVLNSLTARSEARAAMKQSIARLDSQIGGALGGIGSDTRLVVVPEYFLTGFSMGETA